MGPAVYPTSIRGVGVGAAVAVGRIGSIVGPKLGGMLKAAGHSPSQLLMDLLPVVVAGAFVPCSWHGKCGAPNPDAHIDLAPLAAAACRGRGAASRLHSNSGQRDAAEQ